MDEKQTIEQRTEELETHQQLHKISQSLKQLSQYHQKPNDHDSSAIKALLELRNNSIPIIHTDQNQFSLSKNLTELTNLFQEIHMSSKSSTHGIKSFINRRVKSQEFTRLSKSIESEIQSSIDIEIVSNLTKSLSNLRCNFSHPIEENKLFNQLCVLKDRLSRGFDTNLQTLILKSGIFSDIVWVLCTPSFSTSVRENAAVSLQELVRFNKDVFVGSVLVGGGVKALVSMGSLCSFRVLSSLIKAIKSPLVDELESSGGILTIVGYLNSNDSEMRVTAMNCLMEIGYFGRKEAIEVMLDAGLVKRLVELQRGVDVMFSRCVSRFSVQLEVGEGLRQREKRAFKLRILDQVRECCVSDAESATIVAEVLWGSTP